MTTEIKLQMHEKIVIHNITKYDKFENHIARVVNHATSQNYMPHLFWCNGWILDYQPMIETEFIQRELIENHTWHWWTLLCSRLEKYMPKIELAAGGHLLLSDVSFNEIFVTVAKHLESI